MGDIHDTISQDNPKHATRLNSGQEGVRVHHQNGAYNEHHIPQLRAFGKLPSSP